MKILVLLLSLSLLFASPESQVLQADKGNGGDEITALKISIQKMIVKNLIEIRDFFSNHNELDDYFFEFESKDIIETINQLLSNDSITIVEDGNPRNDDESRTQIYDKFNRPRKAVNYPGRMEVEYDLEELIKISEDNTGLYLLNLHEVLGLMGVEEKVEDLARSQKYTISSKLLPFLVHKKTFYLKYDRRIDVNEVRGEPDQLKNSSWDYDDSYQIPSCAVKTVNINGLWLASAEGQQKVISYVKEKLSERGYKFLVQNYDELRRKGSRYGYLDTQISKGVYFSFGTSVSQSQVKCGGEICVKEWYGFEEKVIYFSGNQEALFLHNGSFSTDRFKIQDFLSNLFGPRREGWTSEISEARQYRILMRSVKSALKRIKGCRESNPGKIYY